MPKALIRITKALFDKLRRLLKRVYLLEIERAENLPMDTKGNFEDSTPTSLIKPRAHISCERNIP